MEERDIFWVGKAVGNGEVDFENGVAASDNPVMFRFNEYIVQADECLYMDDSLEITQIDTDNVVKEITEAAEQLLSDKDNNVVCLDDYISLEAQMYIDCLFIDGMLDEIDCDDYVVDREHNLLRK